MSQVVIRKIQMMNKLKRDNEEEQSPACYKSKSALCV